MLLAHTLTKLSVLSEYIFFFRVKMDAGPGEMLRTKMMESASPNDSGAQVRYRRFPEFDSPFGSLI